MKKALKIIVLILATVLLIVLAYVAYVFIAYHRLPDMDETQEATGAQLTTQTDISIVTWNLGYGAYSNDYGFFMDGGTESRAFSKDAVHKNIGHATDLLTELSPDFMILQELDTDATRTYHVDETELVKAALPDYESYFAQNYDSPYLFYPILKPIGASKSGILTLSNAGIARTARRSLPVETSAYKLLDLDRCFSKVWIPTENGRYLVLYNFHLSAYTSDGTVAQDQLELLVEDMLQEYKDGNYIVGGGDFNKDLLGDSSAVFGVAGGDYSWTRPIPEGTIPEGLTLVNGLDPSEPIPSARIADGLYVKGQTFVVMLDGFIVSDNVRVASCRIIDDAFKCSDHNPVMMEFSLEG